MKETERGGARKCYTLYSDAVILPVSHAMAATLLRHRSVNTRDIKFELEATLVAYEVIRYY